jgi:hypothetical protein
VIAISAGGGVVLGMAVIVVLALASRQARDRLRRGHQGQERGHGQ